jgi:hypothetical protein
VSRNYDDLPESEKMAEYIKENKALLAELVAFESEGYTARINFDDPAAPKHDPVIFEEEPEEDQKALNDVLHENYCLRLRCVGVGGETLSYFRLFHGFLLRQCPLPKHS